MVDVSEKAITKRMARAKGKVKLGKEVLSLMNNNELITKKGPVFQTAIIAAVMAAKRTHELIPFCHPIGLEDCQVRISLDGDEAVIEATAIATGRTGVEMEALTAVSMAALTIYDMCKAVSHNLVIGEIMLIEKRGGKKDFIRS